MLRLLICLTLLAFFAPPARAQANMDDVQITTEHIVGNVYMLMGRGGNIGLLVGDDGAFVVDDQYAPLTGKILEAIGGVTDAPVRFVVNTHWHGDHTGGNENMGAAGALIVAHENVRKRMSTEQFIEAFGSSTPPSPEGALPVITFTDVVNFHWNGEDVRAFHVHDAHTDGDAIISFASANVVHMGDTFFNGMYPFIDASSGGSIDGMIAAAAQVLAMADGDTRIIPGHGPLATRDDLQAFHDMLVQVRTRVADLIEQGHDRDAVIAARPTQAYDPDWGGGFMQPDVWTGIVYDTLAK